jgi:hypothetical protein
LLQDCTTLSDTRGRIFLLEALGLVASYLFERTVHLEASPVGLANSEPTGDVGKFLAELEGRHAVACAMLLRRILPDIERRLSDTAVLRRGVSYGTLHGRLDVQSYIHMRSGQRALPRTYPVLITESSAETPENVLVVQALRGLEKQLAAAAFSTTHAEGLSKAELYDWVCARLRRWPWATLQRRGPTERLLREAATRIRKHQTGSDLAYASLLDWYTEWQVDTSRMGSNERTVVTDGILAFPAGDFFWNKVFEVWCLQEVAKSLSRCGFVRVNGPLPLHNRRKGPIYEYRYGPKQIHVWFQQQSPLGTPRWRYNSGPLAGIPDVILTSENASPLIVDAKYRTTMTETRPEETYKMLGYAENFGLSVAPAAFHGLIILVGPEPIYNALSGPNDSRLSLVVVQENLNAREHMQAGVDSAIRQWLAAPSSRSLPGRKYWVL